MYLISRPSPTSPNTTWNRPASSPTADNISSAESIGTPLRMSPMANADITAAAGAQGVVMSRLVPPVAAATSPSAADPRMPASAP